MFCLGAEAGLREGPPVQAVEIPILLQAQRQTIGRLRNKGGLTHEVARKILRELDLHEITLP